MKRNILLIISVVFSSILSFASPVDGQADSAYTAEQYADALALYLQAAETEGTSSDLYYNIGNTLYRQNKIGKAIIAYERALRLDPTNADARTNLDFVNSKIVDKVGERGTAFSNGFRTPDNDCKYLGMDSTCIFHSYDCGCRSILFHELDTREENRIFRRHSHIVFMHS